MIADYHIHTPYCGHAHGTIVEYIESALRMGIKEICFADHLGRYYLTPLQRKRHKDWGIYEKTLSRYISEIEDVKEAYKDNISIKIGLEIDYIEDTFELLEPYVSYYPFDFLIGSIHCLPKFGWKHIVDYRNEYDKISVFKEYLRYIGSAISSKIFHSIAHIDFLWRYIKIDNEEQLSIIKEGISSIVKNAIKNSVCIEINANGYYFWSRENIDRKNNPFNILLDELSGTNVVITIGSDAHEPYKVGYFFDELIPLLQYKNIRKYAVFTKGKKEILLL